MTLALHSPDLARVIAAYGYPAVFLLVGLESLGLPLPGEAALIAAAVYAGTTHQLNIGGVVVAAATGAVIGDNLGFAIGRRFGFPVLQRYGGRIGLNEQRLKVGRHLFRRYGGLIVVAGRFVAALRTVVALMAGANQMRWDRFVLFNAGGAVAWSGAVGLGAYAFGASVQRLSTPIGLALVGLALGATIAGVLFLRRHEHTLLADADEDLA